MTMHVKMMVKMTETTIALSGLPSWSVKEVRYNGNTHEDVESRTYPSQDVHAKARR